ncbi:MAG: helix-turn-helix domain-containing protein [Clostridia bacterium]|nr:helix-turn-helix domain-containing protein [Clostridia bacterium]
MMIGAKLAEARKKVNLTQGQLAEKLGVSFQAISIWERDESMPDTGHLLDLSKALHVSLDELLGEPVHREWTQRPVTFNPEHMYTYVKAKAQAEGLTQTLAALPLMREKHEGQFRSDRTIKTPYAVHPLTLACHAMAMGIVDDDVIATVLLHDVVEDTDTLPEELPVSDRVREAVCLVSYNTYLKKGDDTDPKKKNQIKPIYYANIAKNPLASLVKCMDRCNNLACMADGFSKAKMATYVIQTEQYVLPLLDIIKEVPEYNNASWLLRYQMMTLLETFKRLL